MAIRPFNDPSLSRRERERRMRRQAILASAQAVFAEKGYANATLDEIAERAEFGKGTLYNYFEGGKEEILFAIIDQLYEDLYRHIEASFQPAAKGGVSFREAFKKFAQSTLAYYVEHRNLFMILMKDGHPFMFGDDPERSRYFVNQYLRAVECVASVIEAGIEAGELKPLAPYAVAHILLGNVNGLLEHLFLQEQFQDMLPRENMDCTQHDKDAAVEHLTTLLFDGLLCTESSIDV